jgi:8-oxo-dGTP diphosphatase
VYSKPDRDPRHHCISVAFLFFVNTTTPTAGDDAASAEFIEGWTKVSLAFDHSEILRDAIQLRASLQAIMGKHG